MEWWVSQKEHVFDRGECGVRVGRKWGRQEGNSRGNKLPHPQMIRAERANYGSRSLDMGGLLVKNRISLCSDPIPSYNIPHGRG